MSQIERYIPGVPCWVDNTTADPEAAVAFYSALFGWECEDVSPPGAPGRYFVARLDGGDVAAVASAAKEAPTAPRWNTYVWVQSADQAAERVWAAGGQVLAEPFDVAGAGRMATVADPEGAVFSVWQAARHRGATVVNGPGSLNFNGLRTRDPEAAERFYGAVFGWHSLALEGGALAWALPGYGDHLERRDPGLRERLATFGAPAGFEDVVATIEPISPGASSLAPEWTVTFAVDDADRMAERALELGGRVIEPPFDAPWVRTTILADPQGAAFLATHFTPENRDVPRPATTVSA